MKNILESLIFTIEKNAINNKATISNVNLWAKSWREEYNTEIESQNIPELLNSLKTEMEAQNVTVYELSKRTDLHQSTIHRMLRNEHAFAMETFLKVCTALGMGVFLR